jgi:hypothetical protein
MCLIPKSVCGNTYPGQDWDERMQDLFTNTYLDDFDIISFQELFKGLPGSSKELF